MFLILAARLKGHVKLIQRVKILSFSVFLGSSTYDRKKNFWKPTVKTREMAAFFIYGHFQPTMKVGLSIQLIVVLRLKTICFSFNSVCSNCIHIKCLKLYVSRKFSTYFSLDGMNE